MDPCSYNNTRLFWLLLFFNYFVLLCFLHLCRNFHLHSQWNKLKIQIYFNETWSKVLYDKHCVRSVRIQNYSGPYFPAFGLNTEIRSMSPYSVRMWENTDQNNSKYGYLSSNGFLCAQVARKSNCQNVSTAYTLSLFSKESNLCTKFLTQAYWEGPINFSLCIQHLSLLVVIEF